MSNGTMQYESEIIIYCILMKTIFIFSAIQVRNRNVGNICGNAHQLILFSIKGKYILISVCIIYHRSGVQTGLPVVVVCLPLNDYDHSYVLPLQLVLSK